MFKVYYAGAEVRFYPAEKCYAIVADGDGTEFASEADARRTAAAYGLPDFRHVIKPVVSPEKGGATLKR